MTRTATALAEWKPSTRPLDRPRRTAEHVGAASGGGAVEGDKGGDAGSLLAGAGHRRRRSAVLCRRCCGGFFKLVGAAGPRAATPASGAPHIAAVTR